MLKLFREAETAPHESLAEFGERYISDLTKRTHQGRLSSGTLAMRARYVRLWFEHAETIDPTNADVVDWLGAHPEWKAAATVSDAVSSIIACFHWLVSEGHVDRCRIRKRTLNLKQPQPRPPMFRADARAFLRAIKLVAGYRKSRAALRFAVWFLVHTGCRTCEMRTLRWEWIDLERGIATLPEHKTDASGKARIIYLPSVVLRILRRHRLESGIVMRNGRGRPWVREGFACLFRRYLARAGMTKNTPYGIRHGFCCQCLDDDVDHQDIAELMGHTSTKLIRYYGRSAATKVDKMRGKLDGLGRR